MKILSLGLDNSILDKTSALAKRIIEYGDLVERYAAIVPSRNKGNLVLSEKTTIFGSGGSNKLAQFFNIYKIAKELLVQKSGDAMTVQDQYYLALLGFYLAKKYRIGLEVQVHGFEKYRGLRKLIARYVLPRADAVRAVSRRLKRQLIDNFGVAENKITVAPIYSEAQNLKSKIQSGKAKSINNFVFLTVGRLVGVKNISIQIDVMAGIVKEYPQTELWIVGEGTEKNNLQSRARGLKLNSNIKFFGQQNNLSDFFIQADAFLLTSNAEGWGLAAVEAAAAGLPVIMTDVGCAGELIKNGESGLIIPIGDKAALKNAMVRIIEDDNLRANLARNAREAIKSLPNKEETLNLYKLSWKKLVGQNNFMKLLILTQKTDGNDDLLGFFHGWVAKWAEQFEKITVIALGVGQYCLPDNVRILSLGKEKFESENLKGKISRKVIYLMNFYKYLWRERKNYDAVFVHMNQEYAILGGLFWKFFGKKVVLWRNHPDGDFWARLAVFFSDVVFCTSKFAYVAKYKKTKIMPVGVDTNFFTPDPAIKKINQSILFFGRISPIKRLNLFIEALNILKEKNINFVAKIVGDAPERDQKHLEGIKQMVRKYGLGDNVEFKKGVPNCQASEVFNRHEIFVNLTPSGSLDKMIFEAMSCGTLILVSNKNLETILSEEQARPLMFKEGDAIDLADKILGLIDLSPAKSAAIRQQLRQIVVQHQSLSRLAEKLVEQFKKTNYE